MIPVSKSLIDKIYEILDGNPDEAFVSSVAKEYHKNALRTNARIKQFVKLIHEGNYYAALDIANIKPELTEQIEKIRFPREKEWLQFLTQHGKYEFSGFNDNEIKHVKEVCADISTQQPREYKAYRRSILLKDKPGAIENLRLLFEKYPKDLNAKNEIIRLETILFEETSQHLAKLLLKKKNKEIIQVVKHFSEQPWLIELDGDPWHQALLIYFEHQKKEVQEQTDQLLRQIRVIQRVGDWKDSESIIRQLDDIKQSDIFKELDAERISEVQTILRWYNQCQANEVEKTRLLSQLRHFENKIKLENIESSIGILERNEIKQFRNDLEGEWLYLREKIEEIDQSVQLQHQKALRLIDQTIQLKKKRMKKRHALWLLLIPVTCVIILGFRFINYKEEIISNKVAQTFEEGIPANIKEAVDEWDSFTGRFLSNHNPFRNYAAHKIVKEVKSNIQDISSKDSKITELLDKVESNLNNTINPSEIRRVKLNLSIVEELLKKIPFSEETDNYLRFTILNEQVKQIHQSHINDLRDEIELLLSELETFIQKHFSKNRNDFETAHEDISKSRDLIQNIQHEFNQSFETAATADLKEKFKQLTKQVNDFEKSLLDLENNLTKISSSISLSEYLGYLKNMSDLPLQKNQTVIRVNEARAHIPKFESLAQQLLLANNPIAWEQYTKQSNNPLRPFDSDKKETGIYRRFTRNDTLKNIYTYKLYRYENGIQSDQFQRVFTLGEVDQKQDFAQKTGRIIQRVNLFDESKIGIEKPFSEHLYITETSADGRPLNGDFIELERLTPESGFYRLMDELCAYDSQKKTLGRPILEVLDEIKTNSFIHPIFKSYVIQELFNIMIVRAFDWGLNFSPSAQIDYRKLTSIKGKLYEYDWMRSNTRNRLTSSLDQYYKQLSDESYYKQAQASRELFAQIAKQRIRYAGYVQPDGSFHLLSSTPEDRKLFGLLADKKIGTLRIPQKDDVPTQHIKGVPYTPILFFNDPPDVILDRVTRKTGVDVSSERFRKYLPEVYL